MDEELQLANYTKQASYANKPVHRMALQAKLLEILDFQHVSNTKAGRAHVKFSPAARRARSERTVDIQRARRKLMVC